MGVDGGAGGETNQLQCISSIVFYVKFDVFVYVDFVIVYILINKSLIINMILRQQQQHINLWLETYDGHVCRFPFVAISNLSINC